MLDAGTPIKGRQCRDCANFEELEPQKGLRPIHGEEYIPYCDRCKERRYNMVSAELCGGYRSKTKTD